MVGVAFIGTSLTMDLEPGRRNRINGLAPVLLDSHVRDIVDDSISCRHALSVRDRCRATALLCRRELAASFICQANTILRRAPDNASIESSIDAG